MSPEQCAKRLYELHCCVIIPTYNNATALKAVLDQVLSYTTVKLSGQHQLQQLLVVNDGSTDETEAILAEYPHIMQLSYPKNAGKGIAMRRGFDYAVEQGYTHAITLDSDGQHYASDLPTFVKALEQTPDALVIGSRNMKQEHVPTKSSLGNKISSFWLWVETGTKLNDTQSGYRLYPIKALQGLRFWTGRYEFEIEVMVRAAWKGLKLYTVPIEVYYPPAEDRITHFRPFWDFIRISVLNTFLCLAAFLWYRPKLLLLGDGKKA